MKDKLRNLIFGVGRSEGRLFILKLLRYLLVFFFYGRVVNSVNFLE